MRTLSAVPCALFLALTACEEKKPTAAGPAPVKSGGTNTAAAMLPASLFLASEPANARPVDEVKKSVKAGDDVVVRGRIGGSHDPFVAGRAVFTIMAPKVPACSDNPDDHCKTPWDYCCESKEDIAANSATIQVVDGSGSPIKSDVKGQHGIKELSEVVVVGKVAQAEGQVLVVQATGLYLAKK